MGSALTPAKKKSLLGIQFLAVAAYIWVLYESIVESVIAGVVIVLLVYFLLFRDA